MARITGTLLEDQYTSFIISHSILFRMRNVSSKFCRENQNTHFISKNFFRKSCRLWHYCGKIWYSQTDHGWQYGTAHAHCMLDNYGYRHTLRICNTYCFTTATMVKRTGLSVTLYIHCLSCFVWISDLSYLMWQWSTVIFLRLCWLQQRIHFIAYFWTHFTWQGPALMHYIYHLGVVGF